MKTKEELIALKEEVETLNQKLAELTDEELVQVSGGGMDTWKEPPIEGLSSLSLLDMVAELEKQGLANLGEAVATPGGGASNLYDT